MNLIDAIILGDTEKTKSLLKNGADVNAKDDDSHTPLHWAAENSYTKTAELLKKHGAED
jgi:ankyrin repeat protein